MTEAELTELERMDKEAMPPNWQFETYSEGGRVVAMNAYTVTGEYGDKLPCSGVSRCLTENRQVLCDCCPASARHWVPANHDDQEWQDLAYIAKLRNAAPDLYAKIRQLEAMVELRDSQLRHHAKVLTPLFQSGHKYNNFSRLGESLIDAVPRMAEAYEALRAEIAAIKADSPS